MLYKITVASLAIISLFQTGKINQHVKFFGISKLKSFRFLLQSIRCNVIIVDRITSQPVPHYWQHHLQQSVLSE